MAMMGMKHKLGRGVRLFISYGIDWLVSLIIIVAVTLYLDRFQHFREFDLTDTSIQYPQVNPETVSVLALGIIIGASFIIPAITNLLTIRSWWDLHHSLLGVNIGYAIAGSLTQGIRVVAGRPRPDFISRCNPPINATNPVPFGLANVTICADPTSALVKDGMRSFFSGHASLTAAGMGFCSFYLAGKLHVFNDKGYITKVWLCLVPLAGTIYVCITRTMDNKHHWQDVTIGAIVGLFCAYFAYRQFYPSLTSENAHLPLAPRFPVVEKTHAPREIVLTPGGREIGADSSSGGGLYSEGGMGYMHTTQAMQHGRPPYDHRASSSDVEAGRGSMYKGSEDGYRPPSHVYGEEYPLVPR